MSAEQQQDVSPAQAAVPAPATTVEEPKVAEQQPKQPEEPQQPQQEEQKPELPTAPKIVPERIFIGNLPYAVTEDEVRGLTDLEIVSVEIPKKPYFDKEEQVTVQQSKGYGFITFATEDDAKKAIESINGKKISDREIYAKTAVPQSSRPHNNHYNNYDRSFRGGYYQNSSRGGFNNTRGGFAPRGRGGFVPRGNFRGSYAPRGGAFRNSFVPRGGFAFQPSFHVVGYQNHTPFDRIPQRTKEEKQKRLDEGIPSKTTIFVGNLDRNVTLHDLKEFMTELEPQWIRVPRKILPQYLYQKLKSQGVPIQNKGIAFVRFATEDNQKKAIEQFNGKEFKGKPMNVTVAIDSMIPEGEKNEEGQHEEEQEEQGQVEATDDSETKTEAEKPVVAETKE